MGHRKLAWGAPLGSVVLGAVLIGLELSQGHGTPAKAVEAMVLLVVFSGAIVLLQFRSDTARLLAGQTVDERWAIIHRNAMAAAASFAIVVGIVAYAVVEVSGGENWQFAFMIVAIAILYGVALAWYRWRM